MKIKFVPDGASLAPILLCDVCGKRIRKAKAANAVFGVGTSTQIKAVHKSCDNHDQKGWLPLPVVLSNLLHNVAFDSGPAENLARLLD